MWRSRAYISSGDQRLLPPTTAATVARFSPLRRRPRPVRLGSVWWDFVPVRRRRRRRGNRAAFWRYKRTDGEDEQGESRANTSRARLNHENQSKSPKTLAEPVRLRPLPPHTAPNPPMSFLSALTLAGVHTASFCLPYRTNARVHLFSANRKTTLSLFLLFQHRKIRFCPKVKGYRRNNTRHRRTPHATRKTIPMRP